jgi:nucleoside-diphosphate-sugar epimerase
MKIAITGGAGYIGSFLANDQSFKKLNIIDVIDNSINQLDSSAKCDYRNYARFDDFEVIIHLAGHSSVGKSIADPDGAWENNVIGFRKLVRSLGKNQLLINASSGSVYGSNPGISSERNGLIPPSNTYDLSKMCGDLISSEGIQNGAKIVSLRFGTVAGFSDNMRWDLIVNKMFQDATKQGKVNAINPKVRRGVLFLPDLLKAIYLIISNPVPGIYNLSSINTSVGELAGIISKKYFADLTLSEKQTLSSYDFHLDTKLFEKTFGDFRITNIENILEGLENGTK